MKLASTMMTTQVQVTYMKKLKHLFNLLMWGCWTSYIKDRNSVCSCKRVFKTHCNPTKLSFCSKAKFQLWCLILGIEIQFMVVNAHLKHKLCFSMVGLIYRMSQEECARLRESDPYVKVYRYNPKHLYPRLNCYGDNGQRSAVFLRFHVLHLFS